MTSSLLPFLYQPDRSPPTGKFLPTRRTPGVSTSELLERIVSGYRHRLFDKKLARMGHAELMAEGSDYDDSAPPSGRVSPRR